MKKNLVFLLVAAFFLSSFAVGASSAEALSISPLRYRVTLNPGDTKHLSVTATDEESKPITVRGLVVGVKQDDRGRTIARPGIEPAEQWVKPINGLVTLRPGQSKNLSFLIQVPAGQPALTHYVGLAVESVAGSGGNLSITGQLATLVSLQVAGVVHESLAVTARALQFYSTQPQWLVDYFLVNDGTVEIPTAGSMAVKDWLGDVWIKPMSFNTLRILPGSRIHAFEAVSSKKPWLPGPYQIAATIRYGLSNQTAHVIITVWYCPIWVWIALAALLVLLTGIIRTRRKRTIE